MILIYNNITIYFIATQYNIALILLATLTIQFLFFFIFYFYKCARKQRNTNIIDIHYWKERKKFDKKLFHLYPIERLILRRGWGWGGEQRGLRGGS